MFYVTNTRANMLLLMMHMSTASLSCNALFFRYFAFHFIVCNLFKTSHCGQCLFEAEGEGGGGGFDCDTPGRKRNSSEPKNSEFFNKLSLNQQLNKHSRLPNKSIYCVSLCEIAIHNECANE